MTSPWWWWGGGGGVTEQPALRCGKVLAAVAQHIKKQRLEPYSQVRWGLVYLSARARGGRGGKGGPRTAAAAAVLQYEGRQMSRLVLRTVCFDEATLLRLTWNALCFLCHNA
jgi:hypothetical protein